MAAVDPSESPKRQKSPEEEVGTSGHQAAAESSGCSPEKKGDSVGDQSAERPDGELRATAGIDGACVASHSEVSVGSGAGADKTTCSSAKDLTSAKKMAEAPCEGRRGFDSSKAEDNGKEAKTQERNDKCGMLTLLTCFRVSFSLQTSLVGSSHHQFSSLSTALTSVTLMSS